MTPDPTPQPAHDHGAAGFCTDHAQPVTFDIWAISPERSWNIAPAPDERVETVAGLTEIVRVEMSKGAYQMLPDELPYESAARRVAAAVVAALGDESARLREEVERLKRVAESERSYGAHIAARSVPLIEAYKAERDDLAARNRVLRGCEVGERTARASLAAARAALDRVRALADEWANGNNESIHAAYELRAALDPATENGDER